MMPTADQVARAIVTASRITGADPIVVIRRHKASRADNAHARAYAMLAIADLFGNDVLASRLVGGVRTAVSTLRWQLSKGAAPWFDKPALDRVKRSVGMIPAPETVPPFLPSRPAASERQIKARDLLAEAVRNTAALSK